MNALTQRRLHSLARRQANEMRTAAFDEPGWHQRWQAVRDLNTSVPMATFIGHPDRRDCPTEGHPEHVLGTRHFIGTRSDEKDHGCPAWRPGGTKCARATFDPHWCIQHFAVFADDEPTCRRWQAANEAAMAE